MLAVCTADATLVACCELVTQAEARVYFGMFAVRPALQARGTGRRVLAAAEQLAQLLWAGRVMEMQVIAQREDLIAWYLRRGYNGVALREDGPRASMSNIRS